MTERENYLKIFNKEIPEWVPNIGKATGNISPSFLMGKRTREGGSDIWGVPFTAVSAADGASLPTPNEFILKDITKWRDVIKAPDISDIDWEMMAKRDMERVDYENKAVAMNIHVGYFQQLCNFMGFTEGMCAMYEEPEAVLELMEYLADFYDEVTRKACEYYRADILTITDDTATAYNPFISPEAYRKFFKPYHARMAKIGKDHGMYLEMHDCGRCEDFIADWKDFGIDAWDPAQTTNNLDAIKAKYGRDLILVGCWDTTGEIAVNPDAPEEEVRAEVRRTIDRYGKDGGYVFIAYVMGFTQNPKLAAKRNWIVDEVEKYGHAFYK